MKTTLFFLTLILGTLTIRRDPETGEFYEQNPLMEDILHLQWHLKPCKETPPTRPPSPTTTTITEARTINNYYNIFLTLIETSTMIKNPDTGEFSYEQYKTSTIELDSNTIIYSILYNAQETRKRIVIRIHPNPIRHRSMFWIL
jgi:hypothetical protein